MIPLWALLFSIFFALIIVRVPISIALGCSSLVCLAILNVPMMVIGQRLFTALDSFSIMAVPFFILAGNLMTEGGISQKLTELSSVLMSRLRGGLAMAAVLSCGFFAALSGSGPATVIAIGSMLYPDMVEKGYPKERMAGLFSVAGGLGPIIPPSIAVVVYGTVTGTSISAMFIASAGIGVILMVALLVLVFALAYREKWPFGSMEQFSWTKLVKAFVRALWAMVMPVIVLGGIYGGFFTPTEAGCIAVVYSLFVGLVVYKTLTFGNIPVLLRSTAVSSATILFIIATSQVFSWLFVYAGMTEQIVTSVLSLSLNRMSLLLIIILILLVFGLFMDGSAIMLLLMPVIQPLARAAGVEPLQLAMLVISAIVVGTMTPPVAINIFASCVVTKQTVGQVSKGQTPFFIVLLLMLVAILVFPRLSTFLLGG